MRRGRCCCAPPAPPLHCNCLPYSNLTLTITGPGGPTTTPLIYSFSGGVATWTSACVNTRRYVLRCASGAISFSATTYVGGVCPTGTPVICTNSSSSPARLNLAAQTCSPLYIEYSTAQCSSLSSSAVTKLAITL